MAPKKDAAQRAKEAFTPEHDNPEEKKKSNDEEEENEEELDPNLNHAGSNPLVFDRIVAPPTSGKGKAKASTSYSTFRGNPNFDATRVVREDDI